MGERVPTADQRLVMNNVPWSHFEVQLALRGEAPVPRMAYLDGALELLSRTSRSCSAPGANRIVALERQRD